MKNLLTKMGVVASVSAALVAGAAVYDARAGEAERNYAKQRAADELIGGVVGGILEGPTKKPVIYFHGNEEPRLVIREWKRDFNNNNFADDNEVGEEIQGAVDISKSGLHFEATGHTSPTTYVFYNHLGNPVNEYNSSNNVMSLPINGAPPGEFDIFADNKKGKVVSGKITIIK